MDIHLLTPAGAVLVVQVVDGKVIIPPAPAPDVAPSQPAPER